VREEGIHARHAMMRPVADGPRHPSPRARSTGLQLRLEDRERERAVWRERERETEDCERQKSVLSSSILKRSKRQHRL
jgi:hypothetical protein